MATPPINITITKIRCVEETDEVGNDEPYVIVVGVNLKTAIPQVEAKRYGPWKAWSGSLKVTTPIPPGFDTDIGEILGIVWRWPCWGLNGNPAPIENPDDVIFLVAVMENDDGKPGTARELAKGAVFQALMSSTGMTREQRVSKCLHDMKDILATPTGAPNFDDLVGIQELQLTRELLDVSAGTTFKNLLFSGDGGQYRVRFEFSKAA